MNTLTPEGNKLIAEMVNNHDEAIRAFEREKCAAELERAFAECQTLNLLHGAARIRALKD